MEYTTKQPFAMTLAIVEGVILVVLLLGIVALVPTLGEGEIGALGAIAGIGFLLVFIALHIAGIIALFHRRGYYYVVLAIDGLIGIWALMWGVYGFSASSSWTTGETWTYLVVGIVVILRSIFCTIGYRSLLASR